jgi:hypothetical protein
MGARLVSRLQPSQLNHKHITGTCVNHLLLTNLDSGGWKTLSSIQNMKEGRLFFYFFNYYMLHFLQRLKLESIYIPYYILEIFF